MYCLLLLQLCCRVTEESTLLDVISTCNIILRSLKTWKNCSFTIPWNIRKKLALLPHVIYFTKKNCFAWNNSCYYGRINFTTKNRFKKISFKKNVVHAAVFLPHNDNYTLKVIGLKTFDFFITFKQLLISVIKKKKTFEQITILLNFSEISVTLFFLTKRAFELFLQLHTCHCE